jgi:hypothetical protein
MTKFEKNEILLNNLAYLNRNHADLQQLPHLRGVLQGL